MDELSLSMVILEGTFAVCRLDREDPMPVWALTGEFFNITRTLDEVSVVCAEEYVPDSIKCEKGWRCLKVEGLLDFSLIGILSRLSSVLAQAGISIFAISTFDTDYLLVKKEMLDKAVMALSEAGVKI